MRGSAFMGSGNQLHEAGSEANARAKGILRLEGNLHRADGDVLHIRHSG